MNEQIIVPTRSRTGKDDSNNVWRSNNAVGVSTNNQKNRELLWNKHESKQIATGPIRNDKNDASLMEKDVTSVAKKKSSDNDIGKQLTDWVQNANDLIRTNEFQNFTASTQTIVISTTGKIFHIATLPFTVPINFTLSTTMSVCQHVSNTFGNLFISDLLEGKKVQDEDMNEMAVVTKSIENNNVSSFEQDSKRKNDHLHELIDAAIPIIFQAADHVQHHVGSTVLNVFHGIFGCADNDGSSVKKEEQPLESCCISSEEEEIDNDDEDKIVDDTKARKMTDVSSLSSVTVDTANSEDISTNEQLQRQCASYYIRVSDLGLPSMTSSDFQEDKMPKQMFIELMDGSLQEGKYQQDCSFSHTINALVQDGLFLATATTTTLSPSELLLPVKWKPEGATKKWLRQQPDKKNYSESWIALLEKEILTWSGKLQYNHTLPSNKQQDYNNNIPLFKAQGIINNISPKDLVNFLLDSNTVGEYNQWCLGRIDEVVFQQREEEEENDDVIRTTKIVRSETKVPFTGRTVVLRNLLHAQEAIDEKGICGDGYILVSRSVTKEKINNNNRSNTNEIIWGINLLHPIPNHPNKTKLTTLSQVKSSIVPGFMAHKIGLMGIDDFFKNLRKIFVSV